MQPSAPEGAPPSTVRSICNLGMDGHKESLTIAVQRTHDKRDAAHLARYYRAREHVVVRIPSEAEERVRVLMHCRETFQCEILRSRHFILKFLALSRVGCNDWSSSNAALSSRSTGCALFQPLQTPFTLDDILVVPLDCP